MLPSIFGENLFDDFFSDPFGMMVPQSRDPLYGKHGKNLMKTDVRETENSYELDIDLPGFKKDEVNVELKNGGLAEVEVSKENTVTIQNGNEKTSGVIMFEEGDEAVAMMIADGKMPAAEEYNIKIDFGDETKIYTVQELIDMAEK